MADVFNYKEFMNISKNKGFIIETKDFDDCLMIAKYIDILGFLWEGKENVFSRLERRFDNYPNDFCFVINTNGNLEYCGKSWLLSHDPYKYYMVINSSQLGGLNEIKKRKEEMKLKHMDDDPYGEENWFEEL